MTAKGKQWAARGLRLAEIREHQGFQLRAAGVNRTHANKLLRTLEDGGDLPPVKVAAIGKALYLVDGFHRTDAYSRAGRGIIPALVARMSLSEAKEEARLANTRHGLNLGNKDKARIWTDYVSAGEHLEADGAAKSSRAIAVELNQVYSRESIRRKLKELGLDLNEGDGFAPRSGPSEEELETERLEEAADCLMTFGNILPTIEAQDRRRLIGNARALLDALERGEDPEEELAAIANPLGI